MALEVDVDARAYQWRDGSIMTPAATLLLTLNKAGHPIPDG